MVEETGDGGIRPRWDGPYARVEVVVPLAVFAELRDWLDPDDVEGLGGADLLEAAVAWTVGDLYVDKVEGRYAMVRAARGEPVEAQP